MNTYYELINYINSIQNIDDDSLEKINSFNILLENERYERFIKHIINLLDNKINNQYEKVLNKLNNEKEFNTIVNSIISESENQIKFIQNKLIKESDKNKLYNFIKENNNEIINRLKHYYRSNKNIFYNLDNYYIN